MRAVLIVAIVLLSVSGGLAFAVDSPDQAQIDFANGLFHRGFFKEAVDEYERYLKEYPEGAAAATAR